MRFNFVEFRNYQYLQNASMMQTDTTGSQHMFPLPLTL